jgi:hypothetical protein
MKTIKIPTCWTAEQADSVYRFMQAIQENIWRTYNNELQEHYRKINGIKTSNFTDEAKEDSDIFDDDMPFKSNKHQIQGHLLPFFCATINLVNYTM